jgi:hypothetical protein
MLRYIVCAGVIAACQTCWSPAIAQAHGWRFGCGSYYRGYSYYSPQSYYPSWNGSYYCGSSTPYYNNYYSTCYAQTPSYSAYPQYGTPGYSYGGGLMGLVGASGLPIANAGSGLLQPSYLSLPVGVGYSQPGYLQIPVGTPAGRGSYLQIPVNSGFGTPSYLQIDLGRNPANTVPESTTPGPTPRPLGAVPEILGPTASRSGDAIHRTLAQDIPTVVAAPERNSASAMAVAANGSPSRGSPSRTEPQLLSNATTGSARIQLISWSKSPSAAPADRPTLSAPARKDTSFSLVDDEAGTASDGESNREQISVESITSSPRSDGMPWIAK